MIVAAVATPQRTARPEGREPSRPRTLGCDGYSPFDDGLTLEDTILRVWEALVVEGRAACPVCGGPMAAGSGCSDCGSELS